MRLFVKCKFQLLDYTFIIIDSNRIHQYLQHSLWILNHGLQSLKYYLAFGLISNKTISLFHFPFRRMWMFSSYFDLTFLAQLNSIRLRGTFEVLVLGTIPVRCTRTRNTMLSKFVTSMDQIECIFTIYCECCLCSETCWKYRVLLVCCNFKCPFRNLRMIKRFCSVFSFF